MKDIKTSFRVQNSSMTIHVHLEMGSYTRNDVGKFLSVSLTRAFDTPIFCMIVTPRINIRIQLYPIHRTCAVLRYRHWILFSCGRKFLVVLVRMFSRPLGMGGVWDLRLISTDDLTKQTVSICFDMSVTTSLYIRPQLIIKILASFCMKRNRHKGKRYSKKL